MKTVFLFCFALLSVAFTYFLLTPAQFSIAFADYYDSTINGCSLTVAEPAIFTPGTDVTLVIRTKESTQYFGLKVDVTNLATSITRTINFTDPYSEYTHIIDLGKYDDPGTYKILAGYFTTGRVCELDSAFIIQDPNSKVQLVLPVSPITSKITTIPELKISGLVPGQLYHIKLPNWKGADLDKDQTNGDNSGSQEWLADSSGIVDAVNICNNGQANRTDCTEIFGDQNYSLDLYEIISGNLTYQASVSFAVFTSNTNNNNTSSGNNPCLDTNGDGKVDMCPTAIGNIPTNLGDFATAVLQIALGIAGGIVLILMVIGSIRVMTSSGDPQRVAAGRDMIVAALAGALFIAFSVMIMQFFGTAIVPIPGLTFGT